jgi:pimeloyl-ACP methyl ester carboxylesterase
MMVAAKPRGSLVQLTNRLARTTLEMTGYDSRLVRTSAGRVHVLSANGGGHLPPVVLLHGISSAAVHYLPLLQKLRSRVRRVIAPDMPAHGFSDCPSVVRAGPLKDAMVEAMDAIIDEPAVLFGNSMGGIAAVHYAIARPERVRGLILCSPSGAMMPDEELRRFLATFALDTHGSALAFVDRLFSRRNRMRHAFAWGVRKQFGGADVRELLSSTSPADLLAPEQLASLRMPTLLLWGRDERILPRHHLEFFRRHLPEHARVEEPEGFGHAPYLDDVDGVARRILAFTSEVHELGPAPPIPRLRAA